MKINDIIGFRICWKAIDIQLEKKVGTRILIFRSIVNSLSYELYLA